MMENRSGMMIYTKLQTFLEFVNIRKRNKEWQFKEEIEKNKEVYEKIIDDAAEKIETFIQKASSDNQIQ